MEAQRLLVFQNGRLPQVQKHAIAGIEISRIGKMQSHADRVTRRGRPKES